MNFLIPCFLIETLLWAMLCNNNREDQVCANPTNPHPVGRLARPLSSWQSRPRGGEACLADTRHAECHMMIYPDNFFPNKFTGKVNCEIFAEQILNVIFCLCLDWYFPKEGLLISWFIFKWYIFLNWDQQAKITSHSRANLILAGVPFF